MSVTELVTQFRHERVEGSGGEEHAVHIGNGSGVPDGDVGVESCGTAKRGPHVQHGGGVPNTYVAIGGLGTGGIRKPSTHSDLEIPIGDCGA
jgi:hypothetical protein